MHLFHESHILRVSFLICRGLTHDTGFLKVGNDTNAPNSPSSLPSSAIERRPWRTTESQQPEQRLSQASSGALLNCDFFQFCSFGQSKVFFVNGSLVKKTHCLEKTKPNQNKTSIKSVTVAHFLSAIIKSNVNVCLQLQGPRYICSVQKVQVKREDQLLHLSWWSLNDLMNEAKSVTLLWLGLRATQLFFFTTRSVILIQNQYFLIHLTMRYGNICPPTLTMRKLLHHIAITHSAFPLENA